MSSATASRWHATLGANTYQDLRHHYDPVGNLVYADDLAQRPDEDFVIDGLTVTAERVFTYDTRYQLTRATGRVHNALTRPDFRGDTPTSGSFRGTRRVGLNDAPPRSISIPNSRDHQPARCSTWWLPGVRSEQSTAMSRDGSSSAR
jgi:hypothetical protein